MTSSRTASALLLLLAATAFTGCLATGDWKYKKFDWKDYKIVGVGGNGGNGGDVTQSAETNQAGYKNTANTTQTATANGGAGGNGVNLSKGFPDRFMLVGKGGNGGNGGIIYQKSVTNQKGEYNTATTTQDATANGGNGGTGVNGRKLLSGGHRRQIPKYITIVGFGGNGGKGGSVSQNSVTYQVGGYNKATTTQTATANGGNGGNGVNGRKLLKHKRIIIVAGKGGNGGNGGTIDQDASTVQYGFFADNDATTKQTATANGGNGGNGVNGRKLLHHKKPKFVIVAGKGGNGGNGGSIDQDSYTYQYGYDNDATTTQTATANGGNGGNGVNGRKLLKHDHKFVVVAGKGGNGGNGGTIDQDASTVQYGFFADNDATTTQTATANGGAGGDGVKI